MIRKTPRERFWELVTRLPDGPTSPSGGECWLWRGHVNESGYGKFSVKGRGWYAHRLAYTWADGGIEAGLEIDHRCHQKLCVRPSHLQAVPVSVNRGHGRGGRRGRRVAPQMALALDPADFL